MPNTDETYGLRANGDGFRAVMAVLSFPQQYHVGQNDATYFNFYLGFNRAATAPLIESGVSYTDSFQKHGWASFYNIGASSPARMAFPQINVMMSHHRGSEALRNLPVKLHLKLELNGGNAELTVGNQRFRPVRMPHGVTHGIPKLAFGVSDFTTKRSVHLSDVSFAKLQVLRVGAAQYEDWTSAVGWNRIGGGRTANFKISGFAPPELKMSYS